MWANVEHRGNVVELRVSSIPLSTDFAESVLPHISNQMGLAPSRFRNDNQEQTMRTVANENKIVNGSTNDPNPEFTGCIENKVSTVQKGTGETHLSIQTKVPFRDVESSLLLEMYSFLNGLLPFFAYLIYSLNSLARSLRGKQFN